MSTFNSFQENKILYQLLNSSKTHCLLQALWLWDTTERRLNDLLYVTVASNKPTCPWLHPRPPPPGYIITSEPYLWRRAYVQICVTIFMFCWSNIFQSCDKSGEFSVFLTLMIAVKFKDSFWILVYNDYIWSHMDKVILVKIKHYQI